MRTILSLQTMLLGMETIDFEDPNNPGKIIQMPAVEAMYWNYLTANNIDIRPLMQKSLDINHSIISERIVVGKQRVTFFDEVKPPENEHMLIFAMRGYEGNDANLEQTDWIPGIADALSQNGEYDVLQNGVRIMRGHPNRNFTQAQEEPSSGWTLLPAPKIWQAQSDLELNMKFPNAPTTALQNLAVELWGMKLIG